MSTFFPENTSTTNRKKSMAKLNQQQAEIEAHKFIKSLIQHQPHLFTSGGDINPMTKWEDGSGGKAMAKNISTLHAGLTAHFLNTEFPEG